MLRKTALLSVKMVPFHCLPSEAQGDFSLLLTTDILLELLELELIKAWGPAMTGSARSLSFVHFELTAVPQLQLWLPWKLQLLNVCPGRL